MKLKLYVYFIFSVKNVNLKSCLTPHPLSQAHFAELDQIFYGKPAETSAAKPASTAAPATGNSSITPQQTKKRPKRLLPLSEDDDGKL